MKPSSNAIALFHNEVLPRVVLKENLLVFCPPRPFHKGGWRGRFTKLEYLILNQFSRT